MWETPRSRYSPFIMSFQLLQDVEIIRVTAEDAVTEQDVVVPEYALHLTVNGEELATLMCFPEALRELITGFLIAEGLVRDLTMIRSIRIDEERGEASVTLSGEAELPLRLYGNRTIQAGCGSPPLFPRTLESIRARVLPEGPPVAVSVIMDSMRAFQGQSGLYGRTGGVHSAAMVHRGKIVIFRDDVGRHNAVDKVAGEAAMKGVPRDECVLLSSGRISSDLVTKAAVHGIPVVASRSAPTGRAVEIARMLKLGLAGFVRGKRMNIYAGAERFVLP
ncbi:MAG: formate dehydrogenase accessory sulfurtransferase FdhD [Spirochaetaceae bacterium]|nr:MAG: formate dehydrogenase accessory sulfurtransferase FdhD [Spirochaetaceae bacterium]